MMGSKERHVALLQLVMFFEGIRSERQLTRHAAFRQE
jgi:hypothetical protein